MTAKANEKKYIRAEVPDGERCMFRTIRGNRCANPHLGTTSQLCILHEGRMQKVDDSEVQAIAEQLLANNVELQTRDDVNRFTSQLLSLVAQKRISRQDGSLLAYIASVLLQTTSPVRRKPAVREREDYPESFATAIPREPILREPILRERFSQEPIRREPVLRDLGGRDPITGEPIMPGRSYNPFDYPSKR
jgi:hypothetical protein